MVADFIRFEDFELDVRAYQLTRSGRTLRLERIPMEVLCLLVERRGQLVAREEIIEKLWGENVFLDTDNAINTAIRKIRRVLKDDPEQPRFVQTVTGKGYRFIGQVSESGGPPVPEAMQLEEKPVGRPGAPRPAGKHRGMVVAAALAALLLFVAGYFYFHSYFHTHVLTEKDTIVLADFANTTGDPVFDETLRQGLSVQLQQSPFLSFVSEERIRHMLRLMGQPAEARLTPEIARELCERTGSAAVLEGSIAGLGSQYVLGLRAKSCRTGDILDEEQVQVAKKEDALSALSQIASKFRTRVGESLTTVEKHDTPLAEATTSSLEALKSYSNALKVLYATGSAAALPLFQRALEIDPNFAVAHASLGRVYDDLGESALSAESTAKAYQLRDRASDAEKFYITASYDMQVIGNMEKAEQTCELWIQTYPRELVPHSFLSGIILPALGKYDGAVEKGKETTQLDPDFAIGYNVLAYSYLYLDRVGEAESTLHQAAERKLEIPDFLVQRYDIAFLKSDAEGMQREVAMAQGKTRVQDWISNHQAFALAYLGRLHAAREMSRASVGLAQQEGQRERASLYEAGAALRESLLGNAAAARQHANAALALSKARDTEYGAAVALTLSGDLSKAQKLADDLEKRFPEDTSVRFSYLPTLRGLFALNRREPSLSIELLQISSTSELGAPESSFFGFFGALYPIYVRGLAYLADHQGTNATVEFQKILDHRGIVVSDPIGALAHLQLGRALAMSGDKIKARSAYQDFLALWKDADPDIPVLKQAKAEYSKLQ